MTTCFNCKAAGPVHHHHVVPRSLGGVATVSLGGTRWTLRRARLRPGSLGLSNVTGTSLRLTVHSGSVALLFPSGR